MDGSGAAAGAGAGAGAAAAGGTHVSATEHETKADDVLAAAAAELSVLDKMQVGGWVCMNLSLSFVTEQ